LYCLLFNEAATIEKHPRARPQGAAEASVLVVDDNSPDGTAKIAAEFGEEIRQGGHPPTARQAGPRQCLSGRVQVGARAGLRGDDRRWTRISRTILMPFPTIVAPLVEGYEVCIGSRYAPAVRYRTGACTPGFRSRGGNIYADLALGLVCETRPQGFRAYAATGLVASIVGSVRARWLRSFR